MALPTLTAEQRREALEKATAARKRRADVSKQLKRAEVRLPEVIDLAVSDPAIARMRVLALIRSLPGVGPHRAERAMEEIGISNSRRIQGLGPLQKEALLKYFA